MLQLPVHPQLAPTIGSLLILIDYRSLLADREPLITVCMCVDRSKMRLDSAFRSNVAVCHWSSLAMQCSGALESRIETFHCPSVRLLCKDVPHYFPHLEIPLSDSIYRLSAFYRPFLRSDRPSTPRHELMFCPPCICPTLWESLSGLRRDNLLPSN